MKTFTRIRCQIHTGTTSSPYFRGEIRIIIDISCIKTKSMAKHSPTIPGSKNGNPNIYVKNLPISLSLWNLQPFIAANGQVKRIALYIDVSKSTNITSRLKLKLKVDPTNTIFLGNENTFPKHTNDIYYAYSTCNSIFIRWSEQSNRFVIYRLDNIHRVFYKRYVCQRMFSLNMGIQEFSRLDRRKLDLKS
ncbi:hypothetical protein AGLY_001351 [Aphis glycines]|uniref:Uncharacterized protein n=1 Tax=Aphis glycines TaxID=307491 RepID=A0A6G0U7B5_APHGL|nr:hypothetical protein AGLY_001351 [Aphis glycines]